MSELDALLENASNNTAGVYSLSGETLAVLFFALSQVQEIDVWKDFPDEPLTDSEIDQIVELVDWANDELMREVVAMPVGGIIMWQEEALPPNFLLCDGGAAFVAEWPELFALWGYKYGGSGTQFGLPAIGNRSPMGAGGVVDLDDTQGELQHTLTVGEMPSHRHRIPKASATVNAAVNTTLANARTDTAITPDIQTDLTGGGLPHNNLHPVWGTYFIVSAGRQVT